VKVRIHSVLSNTSDIIDDVRKFSCSTGKYIIEIIVNDLMNIIKKAIEEPRSIKPEPQILLQYSLMDALNKNAYMIVKIISVADDIISEIIIYLPLLVLF
jgi:hypothetical protein